MCASEGCALSQASLSSAAVRSAAKAAKEAAAAKAAEEVAKTASCGGVGWVSMRDFFRYMLSYVSVSDVCVCVSCVTFCLCCVVHRYLRRKRDRATGFRCVGLDKMMTRRRVFLRFYPIFRAGAVVERGVNR